MHKSSGDNGGIAGQCTSHLGIMGHSWAMHKSSGDNGGIAGQCTSHLGIMGA